MNQKPSVEDVLIGPNRTVKKKSKLPKIIIIFILILLLAGGGYFAYNYYTNFMVEKTKTKFFRYLSTNNIESLFDNEIYNTLIEKLQNQTNHSSLNLTATSSFKNEYDLDISKFNVIFNQITDKNQEKDFAELNVKYADNDLISARVINNKNSIAIASDEIADKYIGVNKSNIKKILENNVSSNIISEVDKIGTNDSEENELTDDYKSEKVNEYFKYIYDSIPEENFTERENILINTEDENNLNSKCYEFNTTYLQINNMYINILEKLKNDVDLLNNVAKANNVQENNTVVDTNTTFTSKNTTIDITPMKTTETEDSTIDDILIIKDIISGKKVDKTVDELQEMLENMIDEANTSSVNNTELKISQYVVKEKLKKKQLPIKSSLLDQSIIVGIGNIYADEILFASSINPLKKSNQLTDTDRKNIIFNTKKILEEAINQGGTTIRTYTSLNGIHGLFQQELNVHGKLDAPCPKCGSKILKIKVGGRGTYYCPKCQK